MHRNEIQLTEAKIQITNQAQYNNKSPHGWYLFEEIERGVNQLRIIRRLQSSNRRKNKILRANLKKPKAGVCDGRFKERRRQPRWRGSEKTLRTTFIIFKISVPRNC